MDAERYQRLHELVEEASALPTGERDAFLQGACPDAGLRDKARRLLEETISTRDLLGTPGAQGGPPDPLPPLSGRLGAYELRRELGRGGMGAVYHALDTRTNQPVAIKVLHPFLLLAPRHVERFRREAAAGRRVDHENVVRTFGGEETEKDGLLRHFLVMEYVEGRTLQEMLDALGRVPEGLLREIARQAAAGLQAIHDLGIVHRDLKPSNLLISGDGPGSGDERVRIMDLGVARIEDASFALTREGQFVGSLEYAAPEQGSGRPPTRATDLYSLGVVLYELATGKNPFRRDTVSATLRAHQDDAPAPPSDLRPELSPFFSRLVLTLLAKEPAARFESATKFSAVLGAGETGPWWTQRVQDERPRPQLPVRRDTVLVGRQQELAVLRESWKAARAGDGQSVLLEGEAGLGKSRLVDAFLLEVTDSVHVLYGSFPPTGGRRGLLDAVRGLVDSRDAAAALRPYLAPSPTLVHAFAALATGLPAPVEAPHLGPDAVQTSFVHLARGLAAERPTIWIVEDLHFAGDDTRALVFALARAVAGHRLLLLATSRPTVPPNERNVFHTRVPLGRLSPYEITELLEDRLGDRDRAGRLAGSLARKSDGIPFFLLELARTLDDDTDDDPGEVAVPEAVRDLVSARLDALDSDERALLDAAAVLGYEFDADVCAAILERPLVRILQRLAALERRHGLVRSAGRRYRFDHHLVQEVLVADLPEMLRLELHTLAAGVLRDRLEGEASGLDALRIVDHELAGARPEKAAALVETALAYLVSQYRHTHAIALAQRAMDTDGLLDDAAYVRVLTYQVNAYDMLGRRDEQFAGTKRAHEVAQRCGDPFLIARTRGNLGQYHWGVGKPDEAIPHFDAAIETMRAHNVDNPELFWKLRINRGIALSHADRDKESLKALAHVRDHAHNHAGMRALAASNHGAILTQIGAFEEALRVLPEAIELARAAGKKRAEAISEGSMGLALWSLGTFEQARPHYTRQGEVAREIGDRRVETLSELHVAILAQARGRLADALTGYRSAQQLADEIGEPRSGAVATMSLGQLDLLLGYTDTAREFLDDAGDRATRCHPVLLGYVDFAHAEAAVIDGNPEDARHWLEKARERFTERDNHAGLVKVERLAAEIAPDKETAAQHADTMVQAAREHGRPAVLYGALALHGTLAVDGARAQRSSGQDGDVSEALALLPETDARTEHVDRMRARYWLWRATDDAAHLRAARELLQHLIENAPEDAREGMAARVPLYRRIKTAT